MPGIRVFMTGAAKQVRHPIFYDWSGNIPILLRCWKPRTSMLERKRLELARVVEQTRSVGGAAPGCTAVVMV